MAKRRSKKPRDLGSRTWLQWLYDEYNKRYFGGRLPKIPVKFSKTDIEDDEYGYVQMTGKGNTRRAVYLYLNHEIMYGHWKWCRITMLHECVHVDLIGKGYWRSSLDHGRRFWKEIERLERAGAYRHQKIL